MILILKIFFLKVVFEARDNLSTIDLINLFIRLFICEKIQALFLLEKTLQNKIFLPCLR